jgi:peptidoglycan/LPS O-acetylase OafA/YrhL
LLRGKDPAVTHLKITMVDLKNWPLRPTSFANLGAVGTKSSIVRLEWIDVLRGLAILMVILIHVGTNNLIQGSIRNFTEYGSRGVQLFFIVSAFTLFRSVSKKFNAKSFYIRRFARIAPMFFLALIFYAIIGYFGLWKWRNEGGVSTYILIIPFLHGLSPYGYNSLVPGGWSVACEFLFYYSLPFLALFCRGFRSTLIVLCLAFTEAAIWTRVYQGHIGPFFLGLTASLDPNRSVADFINYAFLYQVPVFVSGMLLVYINSDAIRHSCASSKIWTSALRGLPYLAVIILLAAAASGNSALQSRTATIFIFFFLVLSFSLSPENLLVNKAMILIGKYSFSIYLVHFVFLEPYAKLTARLLPNNAPILQLMAAYGLVATSSYIVAMLTYRFIEDPFIELGHRLSHAISTRNRPTENISAISPANNMMETARSTNSMQSVSTPPGEASGERNLALCARQPLINAADPNSPG